MSISAITIIGAPTSIGIDTYDDGSMRRLDLAPKALRDEDLVARLRARDDGDVLPSEYVDFTKREDRTRNEAGVLAYSEALAERVDSAVQDSFVLVLGGDCSILLGCLLGLRRHSPVGLAYVDAHADFATLQTSGSGSAASMCLALAVGRGESPLAHMDVRAPLVQGQRVALIGHRESEEPGLKELHAAGVLKISSENVRENPDEAVDAALGRLEPADNGFWIHLDADVLDPEVMPAVDSPVPGGPGLAELERVLAPLVRHPRALGLNLTIYDPTLDGDRAYAGALASLLESVLVA